MADLIQKTDTLNQGREKLNSAIRDSETAKDNASSALTIANEAKSKSDSTQQQLDTIVIEGDSSVEAAQARVDEKGVAHDTLKERIDDGFNGVTSQLADIVINCSFPPFGLEPLILDKKTDETPTLQSILDYAGVRGGGTVFVPEGTILCSVLYIPNNVVLKGAGIDRTVIKLMDNSNFVKERIPTGIYPKERVDFFGVENLTYDGNAEGNVDFSGISGTMYNDNYYAHGITNSYADSTTDTNNPENNDDRNAKDFLIKNVKIKNTIRNSLLFGGRTKDRGTVKNVILENAFLDHFIYESHTDVSISYQDILLKGTWRGAAIVLETGAIKGIRLINPEKNPVGAYHLDSLINVRGSYLNGINEYNFPSIEDAVMDAPFGELQALIMVSTRKPKGIDINNFTVNQIDTAEQGINNVPIPLLIPVGKEGHSLKNIKLNNIQQVTLLSTHQGVENILIDGFQVNYSNSRMTSNDHLLSFGNKRVNNGQGAIRNIKIKNVIIPEKAPAIFRLNNQSGETIEVDSVYFENLFIRTDYSISILRGFDAIEYFDVINPGIKIINSTIDGYNAFLNSIRDEFNANLIDSTYNRIPSTLSVNVIVPKGESQAEKEVRYIHQTFRTLSIVPLWESTGYRDDLDNLPFVKLESGKIKLTFKVPLAASQSYQITISL